MLSSLIEERQSLRDNAINEVSSKWGDQQVIGGPVLNIPYTELVKNEKAALFAARIIIDNQSLNI